MLSSKQTPTKLYLLMHLREECLNLVCLLKPCIFSIAHLVRLTFSCASEIQKIHHE